MITILLEATLSESWGRVVELRTDVDLWEKKPVLGTYHVAERVWKFVLNTAVYAAGFKFKFVMRPDMWQAGPNLELRADEIVDGKTYPYVAKNFDFEQPRPTVPPIELGWAHRRLFGQRLLPFPQCHVVGEARALRHGRLLAALPRRDD